jgi:hypothetical protein
MRRYSLDTDLDAFSKALDLGIEIVVTKVVLDLHAGITKRNPVASGRSRAGWMIGIGERPEGMPPPVPEGQVLPPPNPPAASFDGTQIIYITNNLPYIERLEDGYSGQAPEGMVKLALAEVSAEIEQTQLNILP